MPTITIPPTMGSRLRNLLTTIATTLGVDLDLTSSGGAFSLSLDSVDGQLASVKVTTGGQGLGQAARASGIASESMRATLVEPTFVTGTLVAGTKDITLANAAGDRLSVLLVTAGGTPGVLSVKSKSATEVTVQSWLAGTGLEELDTSVVKVYNFGQASS